jgi:SAM-dependent methyltransferase
MRSGKRHEAAQLEHYRRTRYRAPDDPLVAAYAEPKLDFVRRHVPLAGRRVLDVGCGNGVFTTRLAALAGRVLGVDISTHMLGQNPHPDRVEGATAALPFRDRAFDVVFAANLLHHLEDPRIALRELRRCSARHVVLIEPNRWNPLMLGFALLVRAERGVLRSTRRRLVASVEAAGLRVAAQRVTGMISQNNTPAFLVPWLRRFDGEFRLGEYIVLCCERVG